MEKAKNKSKASQPQHHVMPDPRVKHKKLNLLSPKSQVDVNPQHNSEHVQTSAVADLNKRFENYLFERHISSKITDPITESLQKKADKHDLPLDVLEEVFKRGLGSWNPYICKTSTQEQWAFARVNSFISGGKASELDADLAEAVKKKKFNHDDPKKREDASKSVKRLYQHDTPGQPVTERYIPQKYAGSERQSGPCWTGYVQKGTKIKNGKVVPNCVPADQANEETDQGCPLVEKKEVWDKPNPVQEKGKSKKLTPAQKAKAKARAKAAGRPYPNMVDNIAVAKEEVELSEKSAAWQRKEGKNPNGGLNEKGRKSYERENPGSDLKPPQPEGGKRKNSYCARSKGQMKMWPKAAKDPNSRLRRARKKWKCRN